MLQQLSSIEVWNLGYINYIKIDVIRGKIQLVESIFDVIYAKICFIGLTPLIEDC